MRCETRVLLSGSIVWELLLIRTVPVRANGVSLSENDPAEVLENHETRVRVLTRSNICAKPCSGPHACRTRRRGGLLEGTRTRRREGARCLYCARCKNRREIVCVFCWIHLILKCVSRVPRLV